MMSVSHRKWRPPPQQMPLTAQMIGLWICSISRAIGSQTCPIGRVRDSFTSTPVQKNFSPADVRIATHASSSSRKSVQIAAISSHIWTLNEFPACSRFRVMYAIRSRFS